MEKNYMIPGGSLFIWFLQDFWDVELKFWIEYTIFLNFSAVQNRFLHLLQLSMYMLMYWWKRMKESNFIRLYSLLCVILMKQLKESKVLVGYALSYP